MGKVPENILLYRIMHIDNLCCILCQGRICSPSHPHRDPKYKPIGDSSLIEKRIQKQVEEGWKFQDSVSFYFGTRSPMLLRIQTGRGVQRLNPESIIYLISRFDQIKEFKYVFYDRHANAFNTHKYSSEEDLEKLNWQAIQARDWHDCRLEKQAELLVYKEVPLTALVGFGVYNDGVRRHVEKILRSSGQELPVGVRKNWYY